jgi:uncharacterized protein (TIGR01777 family)
LQIALTGSTGLVGSALAQRLHGAGHALVFLRRGRSTARRDNALSGRYASWDPLAGTVAAHALDGIDAVVHLAGENIAARRWNAAHKERVRQSRVAGTKTIVAAILASVPRPRTLVCASGVGFYGDRGDEVVTEESSAGTGFLAEVCREWEAAAAPARDAGVRVVHVRIGMALAAHGGALPKLLRPFRFGVGGRLGSGRQWLSWILLEDLIDVFERAVLDESFIGVFNGVAPNPVTNAELTTIVSRALRRPTFSSIPAPLLRLVLGEMAGPLLLEGSRVVPSRLMKLAWQFRQTQFDRALAEVLQ